MAQCVIKEMYIVASGGTAIEIVQSESGKLTTMKIGMAAGNVVTLKFDARGNLLTIGTDVVQPEKTS